MILASVIALAVIVGLHRFTNRYELQRGRWLRFFLSIPILGGIIGMLSGGAMNASRMTLMPAGLLLIAFAMIWRRAIAQSLAVGFTDFIYGEPARLTGFAPDYAYVRRAMAHGEHADALRLLEDELEKDPTHYEGITMLVTTLSEMNHPADVAAVIEFALEQDLSDGQKERLRVDLAHTRAVLAKRADPPRPEILRNSKSLRVFLKPEKWVPEEV